MSEHSPDYQRGYQAGYHAGQRAGVVVRRHVEKAPDAADADLILRMRWPDARRGEIRTFGGHRHPFRWSGFSWKPAVAALGPSEGER